MNICAQPHNKLTLLMTPTIDSKSEHANQNDKKTKKHAAQMNRVMILRQNEEMNMCAIDEQPKQACGESRNAALYVIKDGDGGGATRGEVTRS